MSFFKRERNTGIKSSEMGLKAVYKPSSALTGKTPRSEDVQSARQSVDFMVGELKSTANQHTLAAKRMAKLNKTIAKMEAGLRHVSRLENDNAGLRDSLKVVQKKLDQKTSWALEQESKLSTLERQHDEMRKKFETSKADIAQRKDREVGEREKLVKQGRDIESLSAKLNQKDERLSSLAVTNQNLQDEIAQTSAELSSQNHRVTELQKSVEELSARLDTKTKDSDSATVELKNMRIDLNEMKTKYFEATSALENAQYNINTQKLSLIHI